MCCEVYDGDVAPVRHGYLGPCVAAPGYDMYYLNVMAGLNEDLVWLAPRQPGPPLDPRDLGTPGRGRLPMDM
ncbi:KduI/IolB domain protein [Actinomyces sp. ICM39]|nr:KduI/IolB domain protein [Actinomyces sp. ICM39]